MLEKSLFPKKCPAHSFSGGYHHPDTPPEILPCFFSIPPAETKFLFYIPLY